MPNTMSPVAIRTMEINRQEMKIDYPQIVHVLHPHAKRSMNNAIFQLVESLIMQQQEQQGTSNFSEMIGTFEIKTNERNVLSLTITNFAFAAGHANGLTLMGSLTFDVETGKQFSLKDLFIPRSPFVQRLSNMIHYDIMERDIPLLNDFAPISPEQEFYIADKALVIYFQTLAITPHYIGIPMFVISVYSIEDIIHPDSPLGRMLPS